MSTVPERERPQTCPDPVEDPEGYGLWCELWACSTCDGTGEVDDMDRDDFAHTCRACDGSGIDPRAPGMGDDEEYDE